MRYFKLIVNKVESKFFFNWHTTKLFVWFVMPYWYTFIWLQRFLCQRSNKQTKRSQIIYLMQSIIDTCNATRQFIIRFKSTYLNPFFLSSDFKFLKMRCPRKYQHDSHGCREARLHFPTSLPTPSWWFNRGDPSQMGSTKFVNLSLS